MIYRLRRAIITGGETLFETIQDCFTQGVSNEIETIASEQGMDETNKAIVPILYERLMAKIQFEPEDIPYVEFEKAAAEDNRVQKIGEKIYAWYLTKTFPMMKPEMTEEEQKQAHMIEELQKWFMLETLDYAWRQHIVNLDGIREGINLRSWGQKAPLIEYKNEAFLLFKRMTYNLISEIISKIGSKKDFDVNALLKKRIKEMEMIEQMVIEQQEESEKKPTKKKKK
jgi:preprotein translocase subunit SecA